ncbi:MAG: cation diffusion facilitator family transporter [Armatimonadetes bacterium]|nr:cation diffusion facilitator family transporter [Armatimonadota bacterium]
MAHDCGHHDAHGLSTTKLSLSILLTFSFVLIECLVGWKVGSLALISDGIHNFTDGVALILSWYGIRAALKPANPRNTFGQQRVSILIALFNSITLLLSSGYIVYEAITRLRNPEPIQSLPMILVASVAVVVNLLVAFWLHRGSLHDINIRSAYVHMIGDALFSVGVVVAGVIIYKTGWLPADPLIAILIGIYIIHSSWGILREATHILLEGAPKGLDVPQMIAAVRAVSGVGDIHDLHVWTISDGMHALSCHLRVEEGYGAEAKQVVCEVKALLALDFEVTHSTIETECDECPNTSLYCSLERRHTHSH